MSGQQNETPLQISLADAIAELRAELSRARRAATGQDIRFSVEEIEVELSLEFGATRSAGGGFKVFSFVDLSGKLGASNKAAHKLKLKLTVDPPLTVFAGVAEFERALIRHRTDEGRQASKRRGVSFGRPQKLRPDQKTLALALIQEGRSISEVARTFNVHPATIHRCLNAPQAANPIL
jgi:hypothetical protein